MPVNLSQLAAGGKFGTTSAPGAIVYQAADPQGGYGCNESCSLPPTPGTTAVRPGLAPTTCKNVINLSFTGSTGATGFSILRGLSQDGQEAFAMYADEISCGDDVNFDLYVPVTNRAINVDTNSGVLHLAKLNHVNDTFPQIVGNITGRFTGLADSDVNAALSMPITVISMDPNSNLAVCTVQLNPNDCSICVNPTVSGQNVGTWSPNCPLFIDALHGYFFPIPAGIQTVRWTECVVATEVVKNYTDCGAY